jgi:hypothetical protein
MKTYRGVEGYLHAFLISALGENEWLLSHFDGIRRWKGSLPVPGVEFRLSGSWRSHYTKLANLTFMVRHSAVSQALVCEIWGSDYGHSADLSLHRC